MKFPGSGPPGTGAAARAPITSWPEAAVLLGAGYERYSFTKGTAAEAAFLVEALDLGASSRVLDVGCGTGRHLTALGDLGVPAVLGVDLAEAFARVARGPVAVGDARHLPFDAGCFDAAYGLCEGGIGLVPPGPAGDEAVLAEVARVLRPGGRWAMTAFSLPFALRHAEEGDDIDVTSGSMREVTELRSPAGERRPFVLESVGYTARELVLLHRAAGLDVDHVWSVGPGAYAERPPDLEHPELLVLATKPLG